jgi:hypothetical protein
MIMALLANICFGFQCFLMAMAPPDPFWKDKYAADSLVKLDDGNISAMIDFYK